MGDHVQVRASGPLSHGSNARSAAHLSKLHPNQRNVYHEATLLQTRGLELFNSMKAYPRSDDDCVAVFLYSSFLGLHVLFDTLLCRHDFNHFLDQFTAYLFLHRGVRAVLSDGTWPLIQSHLKPIIGDWELDAGSSGDSVAGHECKKLETLIDASDLSPSSSLAYRQAVKSLQWAFDLHLRSPTTGSGPNAVVAWLIIVPPEFVDMIKRRPEALVILAYYAVLLHDARSFWVFGDGGRFLIRSISTHPGKFWEELLAWPNQVLEIGI